MRCFMFTGLILGPALLAAGCGGDDDLGGSGGGSSSTSSTTDSTTSTTTTTGGGISGVELTITVDTTQQADGSHLLAEVKPGEQVFLVGDFNGWNPQDSGYAMTPVDGQPGFFSISLRFPLYTNGAVLDSGAQLIYKYAKTTDDQSQPWGNGIKDVFPIDANHACPNAPAGTAYGLFETMNYTLTVPDTDQAPAAFQVPAWRDLAESYGLPTCT
jgi:hypothetical protein